VLQGALARSRCSALRYELDLLDPALGRSLLLTAAVAAFADDPVAAGEWFGDAAVLNAETDLVHVTPASLLLGPSHLEGATRSSKSDFWRGHGYQALLCDDGHSVCLDKSLRAWLRRGLCPRRIVLGELRPALTRTPRVRFRPAAGRQPRRHVQAGYGARHVQLLVRAADLRGHLLQPHRGRRGAVERGHAQ